MREFREAVGSEGSANAEARSNSINLKSKTHRDHVCDRLSKREKNRLTRLRRKLLAWYQEEGRDFPWRSSDASNYERICVEVLLQRTRAESVAQLYQLFFERYPSWGELAGAPIDELEQVIKPLGLWRRRARSINALANFAYEHDGSFPKRTSELVKIPAVGQYVANAIQLFQHGKAKPLLDVNMARLLERYLRQRRLADIRFDPWLQEACHWLVNCKDPIAVNWAVLDHAALTCRASGPRCLSCTFQTTCTFPSVSKGKT